MPRFTLKTKITLTASLLMAALLSIFAISAQLYFVNQTKQLIYDQQFAMVSAMAEQIDDRLLAMQTELVTTARTISPKMIGDQAQMERFFQNRPDAQAMFDNGLYLFSPQGRLLFNAPRTVELQSLDFSGHDFFSKTLSTGRPVISDPFFSNHTHRHPVIMFTAPVFAGDGKILAVLGGSIDLTKTNFIQKIGLTKMGQQGYLYLFSNSRAMIAHPDLDRLMKFDVRPGANLLYDKAITGFEGTGETTNSRGVEVITSFKRLKTTGWIVGCNYNRAEAFAAVQRAERFLLAALAVVYLASLAVAWFLTRRVTAPLIDLTRQIRALAQDGTDGETRISTQSGDEVGLLGDAFNQLLDELAERKRVLSIQLAFSQRLLDTTPIPLFYKDKDGKYLGCNKAFESFTGVSRDQAVGKTLQQIASVEVTDSIAGAPIEMRGDLSVQEVSASNPQGRRHHVLLYKNEFPAADGTTGVIGAILDVTEAKEAHAALQAQKEFAETLVSNFTLPTFVLDRQHRVIIWNHACEVLTGVKSSEILGSERVAEILHSDRRRLLADLVLQGGDCAEGRGYASTRRSGLLPEAIEAETWYRDRAGRNHYLSMTAAPIRDSQGNLICAIQTLEDITERKQAQDAHEKTLRRLQLILDAAGDGIYGMDMEGRVTFANPAAAQMVGWEVEDLVGKDCHSLLHHTRPDGTPCPEDQCTINAVLKEGRAIEGSEVLWRKDGASFTIDFVSTPLREDGELVGVVVIFRDTSERNQVQDQIIKLSQAVVQSPISVVITDTAGVIEYVNPKFTQTSGYQPDEVLGQTPRILKSGKTGEEVYRDLWATVAAGSIWSGEIYNRHKDGASYCEHITISPIRNSTGVISHYLAFKENVTDRKRLEDQLRHAQKMEAIGQLAGGVAHDFNNILTVIMGFGQMVHHSLDTEDARRGHMEQILDAADRATQLTKSLLAFSRKQVMLLQQVELNELARKHSKFLIRIIGEDVTLKTTLGQEKMVVLADSGQIEQVLMNLATNARDAMPRGGELLIKTETVQLGKEFQQQHGFGTPGRYALISITDTGEGMDAATQQKIFEPFFTTKEPGRGTGLGLSIVYGIVKQHGGYITISSKRGVGTAFSVYLPLATGQEEVVRKAPALVPSGGHETILVVEDDPAVRRLVESVLKRFGYNVLIAESGDEAIEIFQDKWQDIDLALMDVIMPKMDGSQVCAALRERRPALKVLFLSGYTADVIEDKGITVGGIDIMSKPAKPIELAKRIRELLDAA